MSLLFPYFLVPHLMPIVSLAGRTNRPKALIDVAVLGPTRTRVVRGLLDTGADETVFPAWVAADCGIDLSSAPGIVMSGIAGGLAVVQFTQATLRIATNLEHREWTACVGFTAAPLSHALLGFAGFLQFFDVKFLGEREEVELTINGLYPGT